MDSSPVRGGNRWRYRHGEDAIVRRHPPRIFSSDPLTSLAGRVEDKLRDMLPRIGKLAQTTVLVRPTKSTTAEANVGVCMRAFTVLPDPAKGRVLLFVTYQVSKSGCSPCSMVSADIDTATTALVNRLGSEFSDIPEVVTVADISAGGPPLHFDLAVSRARWDLMGGKFHAILALDMSKPETALG